MTNQRYHDKFIFRSPVLPNSSKLITKTDFFSLTKDSTFKEAIYLASPALYAEMLKWHTSSLTEQKEIEKLQLSLYKYYTRMQTRCTPYGLFAGLSIGTWQEQHNMLLNADLTQTLNRKTRLDMNVLCNLAQELAKQNFVKPYLKFYPNTSIYLIGNSYRYIEYYYKDTRRFHKINKVDFTDYLEYVLQQCKNGLTQQQISGLLINEEINLEEATNFTDELISAQLLINQLEPTVTGEDYFDILLKHLNDIYSLNQSEALKKILSLLNEVDGLIKNIDKSVFNPIESYKDIHEKLKEVLPELSETNLFQTDLYKNATENNIHKDIQQQIKHTLQFLNKITPANTNKKLDEFRTRFYERYEDYEIPLLVALDTETGVGYPAKDSNGINELIEDVYGHSTSDESDVKWSIFQAHLLKLITSSLKHNKKIIEISEKDFKNIDFSKDNLPHSHPAMFKVLNASTNKIELYNVGGSSAINLLGRFAGGNKELSEIVESIAEFEQKQMPDKILAEIVHLPESRTGNILSRPNFRSYEIPYLAKSSAGTDCQVKMEDLILKIQNNKIILFDKRLNKEIIPRLGNAHNYSFNSLPVYNFLCDLQTQYFSKPNLGFNWGVLANQFNFLPRVEYQNTVLSAAKWQLNKIDLEPLQDKKKSHDEKSNLFFELKKRLELPDKFLIADGDNELLIDCNNEISVDTFLDSIKKRNEVTLEEFLFESENALIKDTNGNAYTNECIAIIFNEVDASQQISSESGKEYNSKQVFSIGSEWLFYKIYCGAKTADFILTEKLKQITENLLQEGSIDKWFFIRYADPDIHIRFRLHISDFAKYGEVLQLINRELEPLLNQHIISKIQADTYKRELGRYGDNSMELAEQLFYYDSVFVSDMLNMLDAESGGTIRWQMAIRSVDEFLNDFKLPLQEKYNLIERLSNSFFNEHGGKKELKVILDNKFRNLRAKVEDVLNVEKDEEKEYYPIIELLHKRSESNIKVVEQILILNTNHQLQINLPDLLASLLHMNLDRLFMGRNRTNEFVVYDLLFRYYKSSLARLKSESKKQTIAATEVK